MLKVNKQIQAELREEILKIILISSLSPMSLTANIRYEKLSSAYGENFNGYYAETGEQIKDSFRAALQHTSSPSIINIAINPTADRKAQEFPWLTKSKI